MSSLSPDGHCEITQNNQLLAQCSLWWRNTPPYLNEKLGYIGQYGANSREASHALLHQACQKLASQGCTMAIAPINGNTWNSYRFITYRGSEPPFFLEPDNPNEWVGDILSFGFSPFAEYYSALTTDLTQLDPRLNRVRQRLQHQGVQIRTFNLDSWEAELANLYHLCCISFRSNFLYTPISQAEFIAQYQPILPYLKPEFFFIAECQQQTVGFLFAIPDYLQTAKDTLIIKTVAILPSRQYAGLGNVLVADCQTQAASLGYRRAIHALMHAANPSRNLSARYAQTMRRYSLFAKPL
ncbi:GNAT family N-acetyltransferase [Desertifilum sp. FACHB-1129]|uniref:N-acetyltransferase domain-containing protein n=1 Tax=Desertifilum tharense IPPAS B-1220 TaxID=1781255 RepID=A0A1E5QIH4_9CYAN|nr:MULTISPECIES: GNAT family N-acetyltransferase [Desertifilum]MDA0211316.1 GNAT family N-acetyltransferase [Cyanobacteria bacterium FC1]MBD2314663.1 GNAT family N-acetyltransferase [Desertifilum sp. FACHB-1129]MBD2320277.1 GNAT family N-acetyltransferase [Desertifilum sp. FACHB-866]MBD2330405.1 GNAT family N-acetyltransferase [Desertifilum sp. FACHB-868]OEJ74133.1 hypothetical protein BH720_15975 [Desertifilum tharense IPPAS B-1220]